MYTKGEAWGAARWLCQIPASALTPLRTACRTLISCVVFVTFGTVEFLQFVFLVAHEEGPFFVDGWGMVI